MKLNLRLLWILGGGLLFVSLLTGFSQLSHAEDIFRGEEGAKPYTHLNFENNPNNFQFAVIGDRTGGGRPGVLPAAVDLLNLVRPEFVVNVGDLIEGYVEDEAQLKSWWREIEDDLKRLDMPFFMVPGNHDGNLDPSEKVWFERVGANRTYSHFIYKDVLFLLMSTEAPPKKEAGEDLSDHSDRVTAGTISSPEEAKEIIVELEAWAGAVNISDTQV